MKREKRDVWEKWQLEEKGEEGKRKNIQMERKEGKEDGEREGLVDEVRIKEEAVDLLELSVELWCVMQLDIKITSL